MNISIIFIVTIGLNFFLNGSQHQITGNTTTLNITVASPEVRNESAPIVVPKEDSIFQQIQNISWQKKIASQWAHYRFSFLAAAVAAGYGYLWLQLYQARTMLKSPEAWNSWKHHITIEHLITLPHDELSRELFLDIQERYINIDNPTDFLLPLASFLPILEKERILLERYVWWGDTIKACRCSWFFPINQDYLNMARDGIRRLKFLKGLFVAWWAAHNSQHGMVKK